jgi:hypothetical protein
MQMNPHFVFNALNSIQSYIMNKEEQMANTYLTKFAALIRQFLDSSRSKYISLDEEITNLKLYVELEKLRFENKFDYVFDLDNKLSKYSEIPTMLLQPFIENAINEELTPDQLKWSKDVLFDIKHSKKFLKTGGIIVGDDYEVKFSDVHSNVLKNLPKNHKDISFQSKQNKSFHPGVTKAVYECFGNIDPVSGLFVIKK